MESTPIKRRLTAILAADAVNYSRHMGEDEEGTLRELAAHRTVIDRIIEAHEGRIVGTAGDSVLAEFASPVEAVRCAVEIQEGVQTRNETLPEGQRLVFRIGVNLGDVMIDGADILGDGVNVAARLEGIADPGGICISSSVYDQIAGKLSLGFVDLGERSLKNIARPIRVYQFDRSGALGGAKRSGAARKRAGAIAAGFAVVALAAFGAWRAGWVGPPAETRAPAALAPAIVPVAVAPVPASEEIKMKLQIAEAERAKAEAELARARADNDGARQRAEAESARQRAAPRKDTPASVAPAVALPSVPASVPPGASEGTSTAAVSPAAVQPEAAPTRAPPPVASVASPRVVAPAVVASAVPTYVPAMSGGGTATRECDGFEDMRPITGQPLTVRVDAGDISVERGTIGQVGYVFAKGRPSPDGQLTLVGTSISANKRNLGKEISVTFSGGYADGVFALSGRTGARPCKLTIRLDRRP